MFLGKNVWMVTWYFIIQKFRLCIELIFLICGTSFKKNNPREVHFPTKLPVFICLLSFSSPFYNLCFCILHFL